MKQFESGSSSLAKDGLFSPRGGVKSITFTRRNFIHTSSKKVRELHYPILGQNVFENVTANGTTRTPNKKHGAAALEKANIFIAQKINISKKRTDQSLLSADSNSQESDKNNFYTKSSNNNTRNKSFKLPNNDLNSFLRENTHTSPSPVLRSPAHKHGINSPNFNIQENPNLSSLAFNNKRKSTQIISQMNQKLSQFQEFKNLTQINQIQTARPEKLQKQKLALDDYINTINDHNIQELASRTPKQYTFQPLNQIIPQIKTVNRYQNIQKFSQGGKRQLSQQETPRRGGLSDEILKRMLAKPSLATEMIQYLGGGGPQQIQNYVECINKSGVNQIEKTQLIDILQQCGKRVIQSQSQNNSALKKHEPIISQSYKPVKFDVRVHIMDTVDPTKLREIVPCRKHIITKSMKYFQDHVKELQIQSFESIDIHVQCDPTIFKMLYRWSEAENIQNEANRITEVEKLQKQFNSTNILQILISSDYLVMHNLKKRCLEHIRKNNKNLLRDAYNLIGEIPLDQIEDSLFDEIAKYLMNDFKGAVRLIQIEKELLLKLIEDEEQIEDDNLFDQKQKVVEFVQRLLFKMLEFSLEEIQTSSKQKVQFGKKTGVNEQSYNPFQVCKFCNEVYPHAIFQLSNQNNAKKYFECDYAPPAFHGIHMADHDISFDLQLFLQKLRNSLDDQYFLVGRVYVNIISRHIYAICITCNKCYTYNTIDRCYFHPENKPHFAKGAFAGMYTCCGQICVKNVTNNEPGCKIRRHQQFDINSKSEETEAIKQIYKKIGFLEAQSKFVQICDYFQDWSIKKDHLSAKEMAIQDLFIPFQELLESYIQNLRAESAKKLSDMRLKKESDMSVSGGGNPQDDCSVVVTQKKNRTLLQVPTRTYRRVTKGYSSKSVVEQLELDSDEEPWEPYLDCPYPQLKSDNLRAQTSILVQQKCKELFKKRVIDPKPAPKIKPTLQSQPATEKLTSPKIMQPVLPYKQSEKAAIMPKLFGFQ